MLLFQVAFLILYGTLVEYDESTPPLHTEASALDHINVSLQARPTATQVYPRKKRVARILSISMSNSYSAAIGSFFSGELRQLPLNSGSVLGCY